MYAIRSYYDALPAGSTIRYNKETVDFRTKDKKFSVEDISGQKVVFLKPFASCRIEILVNGQKLGRNFEQIILRKASFLNDTKEHLNTYKKIAAVTSITRGANDGFAMYPMLARYYLGLQTENDRITSYNVCYTKLLRFKHKIVFAFQGYFVV